MANTHDSGLLTQSSSTRKRFPYHLTSSKPWKASELHIGRANVPEEVELSKVTCMDCGPVLLTEALWKAHKTDGPLMGTDSPP